MLSDLRPKIKFFDHFWSKSGQFEYGKKTKKLNFNYTNHFFRKKCEKILGISKVWGEWSHMGGHYGKSGFFRLKYIFRFLN